MNEVQIKSNRVCPLVPSVFYLALESLPESLSSQQRVSTTPSKNFDPCCSLWFHIASHNLSTGHLTLNSTEELPATVTTASLRIKKRELGKWEPILSCQNQSRTAQSWYHQVTPWDELEQQCFHPPLGEILAHPGRSTPSSSIWHLGTKGERSWCHGP